MVDPSITFKNISVEFTPGESHVLIQGSPIDEDRPTHNRPLDIVKESLAVGKLMEVCKNDAMAQNRRMDAIEAAVGRIADALTALINGRKEEAHEENDESQQVRQLEVGSAQ